MQHLSGRVFLGIASGNVTSIAAEGAAAPTPGICWQLNLTLASAPAPGGSTTTSASGAPSAMDARARAVCTACSERRSKRCASECCTRCLRSTGTAAVPAMPSEHTRCSNHRQTAVFQWVPASRHDTNSGSRGQDWLYSAHLQGLSTCRG